MAIPFSEFPKNPLNFKKFKKNPKNQNLEKPKKTNYPNLKSFWAFLSSIFIYISVFYIFNLSPSTLICTTKFWFLISNTLVLIVAADFAAFSSSTKWREFYEEEHVIKYTTPISSKSNIIISNYEEHVTEDNIATSSKGVIPFEATKRHHVEEKKEEENPKEKIIKTDDNIATSSKRDDVVPFEATKRHHVEEEEEENPKEKIIKTVYDHHKKKQEKCARSNSEHAVVALAPAEEEGKAMVLHRTLAERHDREEQRLEDEEINDFSRMSNEEVNRRAEEFIRRFNRQIRLQAVRNRQN